VTLSYSFRAARYDFGPRKATLGLALHMSEGTDQLVEYLAGQPRRNVSANFALLSDGTTVRMLPWPNASGSMNPRDRASDNKGYYGARYLKAVLSDGRWQDPNAYVLSLEIAGYRAKGPTPAQVAAAIAWGLDMRRRFPTLRGAFGHADQTDTKGCPGETPAMKAIFEGVGGHGLFARMPTASTEGDPMIVGGGLTRTSSHVIDLPAGQPIHQTPGGPELVRLSRASTVEYFGLADGWYAVEVKTAATFPDGLMRPVIAYVPPSAGTVRAK